MMESDLFKRQRRMESFKPASGRLSIKRQSLGGRRGQFTEKSMIGGLDKK